MLKWSVTRKVTEHRPTQSRRFSTDVYVNKWNEELPGKRRRSGIVRRRSTPRSSTPKQSVDLNKENCFTSTPIKSLENYNQYEALRDVSNLTPTLRSTKRLRDKQNENQETCFQSHSEKKKKKKACTNLNRSHSDPLPFSPNRSGDYFYSNYFKQFELVDSHIEGLPVIERPCAYKNTPLGDALSSNRFAPTLPTFDAVESPCSRINCNISSVDRKSCPSSLSVTLNCDNQVDEKMSNLFGGSHKSEVDSSSYSQINVSPLVKRLIDLRFSKVSYNARKPFTGMKHNDSSYINDLSLDKIVDEILDITNENENGDEPATRNADLGMQERDNDFNETHEENLINIAHERCISVSSSCDRISFDSGFSSTSTKQAHDVGVDFVCKCSSNDKNRDYFKKWRRHSNELCCDKTIIDVSEAFNERCVDRDFINNERVGLSPARNEGNLKRTFTQSSIERNLDENACTLKRQKCIRRRKTIHGKQTVTNSGVLQEHYSNYTETQKTYEPFNFTLSENRLDYDTFSPYDESFWESLKYNRAQTYTAHNSSQSLLRRTRRCLSFESSSIISAGNGSSTPRNESTMDLEIVHKNNVIVVKVLRCRELNRSGALGSVNAYVKVSLNERLGIAHTKSGILQRTAVQANSSKPTFNHTFTIPISRLDVTRRLSIEVWHRDRIFRRSELLGCMSFAVKNIIKKETSGTFRLLPQSLGRNQNVPATSQHLAQSFASAISEYSEPLNMCDSQATNDEIMSIDDFDGDILKTTNPVALNQHQKDADENLFLRYLELDPTEGPDAIPAALQRKATGNKNGRTPFTTTRTLMRPPKSGFGFSVVWTHPPRIERVEKGLPAEKVGILPGDYIIFVDKHNVVMMPEIDILNLIRSYGNQITLEIFRRNSSKNGSTLSIRPLANSSGLPSNSCTTQHRPSTVGSINTASVECSKRRLHLPQVTFSAEKSPSSPDDARRKAMLQLLAKEQHYCTLLQFAVTRFVSALAERKDLITPAEHRILFQNSEEILRLTEDILDIILPDDGEPQISYFLKIYHSRTNEIASAYKRYCSGIKKADCILVNKTKNPNSDFVRFLNTPAIPRRRPDVTAFIHKPLEHYREILKLFNIILSYTKTNHEDFPVLNRIVQDLQVAYREMTSEAGLMEPVGEGRPLLSVQDLENRLVFTKCKPFVLSKPGRQWIFGGDLGRVEGRNVRQYWALLFSDLILFAKVSRDRVLFIIEDPLPLSHITELMFSIRKKATEFRIIVQPGGNLVTSPTVHCGPDLTRTPKKNANKRCIVLRAPSIELKAVWQNLLQRQIFQVNSGMDGSSFSSPLESPDAPITSSVATLQSAESLVIRRQNLPINHIQVTEKQKQIDELIEHKCKQMGRCSSSSKGSALHLEQWMKGQLGRGLCQTPEDEPMCDFWTDDMLRRRSRELNVVSPKYTESRCEEYELSDHSPSKSTESQVTVRSSPIVPENVPVCKQCHRTCFNSNNNVDHSNCSNNNTSHNGNCNADDDDFGRIMLMGLCAVNPTASLVKIDPFSPVPQISVVPPTPEVRLEFKYSEYSNNHKSVLENNCNEFSIETDNTPDDSPQDEEQPYHSLSSSNPTLRRFGTVSSLERVGSQETEDNSEISSGSDCEDLGVDNQAFDNSAVQGWTARAGAFVSQKIAFFERLGEDYMTGTGFFDRYLKTSDLKDIKGEDDECENSATSGDELWGTPTSGDEDLFSTHHDARCSPNGDSETSENGYETELMMDELLMAPPIISTNLRGLLPRRTLEPLMEEDSDTYSSSSSTTTEQTPSSKQGNGTGGVADICWTVAESLHQTTKTKEPLKIRAEVSPANSTTPTIVRSDSYRKIIEAEDDGANFFNRFKSSAKIINVERIPRSRGVKLFEIFYVKKNERKIHETFPEGSHLIKIFNREGITTEDVPTSYAEKPLSPRKPKDKQMDGRFWRQLSRRRGNKK